VHVDRWSGGQYSLYRVALGSFVCWHFLSLLPYGEEVFAAGGVLEQAALSPYIGVLPNPLAVWDSAFGVGVLLVLGALACLALAVGYLDRIGALVAAVILAWLFQRNPLIANPSLPLLGWLLLMHVFVPSRPYGSLAAHLHGGADPGWRLPQHLHLAAWVMLALAYSYSGYSKLYSPSWVGGDSIRLVLENPLARDHALRTLALATPPLCLQLLTWTVLGVELLFAPLALLRGLRPWLWLAMLGAQFGFLVFLNFADLTLPMLLAHLLTFDPRWVARRVPTTAAVVLFDGSCAFCHACVRLAAMEDQRARLSFAPLQGPTAIHVLEGRALADRGDSIVVVVAGDAPALRSRAVAAILERLGGVWYVLGRALRLLPRSLADRAYDTVGRVRLRLGGHVDACPLPAASHAARLLP
jgi:predicted DCC family thiol-disulfide oxidoreductase YuxK